MVGKLFAIPLRLLVVIGLLLYSAVVGATSRILLLHQPPWSTQEVALQEALRIYLRDLHCAIVVEDAPAALLGARDLAQIAQQGRRVDATVVAWFSDVDGLRFLALRVSSGDVQSTSVIPSGDVDVVAPTLALKLRALLIGKADRSTIPESASDTHNKLELAGNPAGNSKESPVAPPADSAPPVTAATPSVLSVQSMDQPSALARKPLAIHLELGLGYAFNLPTDPTWLRHGLELRAGLVLGSIPLLIELDGAIFSRPSAVVGPYQLTMTDVPLGLSLSARLSRSRLELSAGVRTSLHILNLGATMGDSQADNTRRFSAGLGVLGQVRVRLLRFVSLNLAIQAEGTVPRQRFTVAGEDAADLGWFRFGASLGAVFRVR